MSGYRHLDHAGNFADVTKHVILLSLLRSLQEQDTAVYFQDTHAGAGRYDLDAARERGRCGFENGIARLYGVSSPPPEVRDYLAIVHRLNPQGGLRWYPGSPRLARELLRPRDRMLLNEHAPQAYQALQRAFADDGQVELIREDAYRLLQTRTLPAEYQHLILIDPPYADPRESDRVHVALTAAHRQYPDGVFALWYPITGDDRHRRLRRNLANSGLGRVFGAELCRRPPTAGPGLDGCGMLLINPPGGVAERLPTLLDWLWHQLSPDGTGGVESGWISAH